MYQVVCLGEWSCSSNLLIMVGLFFIAAIARKQLDEVANIDFSIIGATVLGVLVFAVLFFIFGSVKWSFLAGLAGVLVGGFAAAPFFEGSGGGDDFN